MIDIEIVDNLWTKKYNNKIFTNWFIIIKRNAEINDAEASNLHEYELWL